MAPSTRWTLLPVLVNLRSVISVVQADQRVVTWMDSCMLPWFDNATIVRWQHTPSMMQQHAAGQLHGMEL